VALAETKRNTPPEPGFIAEGNPSADFPSTSSLKWLTFRTANSFLHTKMDIKYSLSLLCLLILVTAAAPNQNITIEVPPGTSNHGDPHLLCTPTRTVDVASFFLLNYVAHAVTVRPSPGEHLIPSVKLILFALVFPTSGISKDFVEFINKRHAKNLSKQL